MFYEIFFFMFLTFFNTTFSFKTGVLLSFLFEFLIGTFSSFSSLTIYSSSINFLIFVDYLSNFFPNFFDNFLINDLFVKNY